MKKIFFVLVFVCVAANLCSQNYIAEYNRDEIIPDGRLLFNSNAWIYEQTSITGGDTISPLSGSVDGVDFADMGIELPKTITRVDTVNWFNFRSLEKNYYMDEEIFKYVIKDNLVKPEWIIFSDSAKMIENYQCLMAKGYIRGRDYTAWFTPDIPVSAGPWKLWGLPGLIVSARSDDGKVDYTMTHFLQTDLAVVEPDVEKTVSPEEFKKLFREDIEKIRKDIEKKNRAIRAESNIESNIKIEIPYDDFPDKTLYE
jgi:hypothetical protein